jgi:hypothetical protein
VTTGVHGTCPAPPSLLRFQRVETYCGPALWAGPRHCSGQRVILLVTSCAVDLEPAPNQWERTKESTLLLVVDSSQGPEAAAASIVACYRWLLAQLVPSSDVYVLASEDLRSPLEQAVCRLRSSGDEMPALVGVRP